MLISCWSFPTRARIVESHTISSDSFRQLLLLLPVCCAPPLPRDQGRIENHRKNGSLELIILGCIISFSGVLAGQRPFADNFFISLVSCFPHLHFLRSCSKWTDCSQVLHSSEFGKNSFWPNTWHLSEYHFPEMWAWIQVCLHIFFCNSKKSLISYLIMGPKSSDYMAPSILHSLLWWNTRSLPAGLITVLLLWRAP